MWKRCKDYYVCPKCRNDLNLTVFHEEDAELDKSALEVAAAKSISTSDLSKFVESGIFTCDSCKAMFPIFRGLPVFLLYQTDLHREFLGMYSEQLNSTESSHRFLDETPPPGEELVMKSFSTEWLNYDYDGVIWELSYEDHEERFLKEVGIRSVDDSQTNFLEVGCGIGNTTFLAHKNFGIDVFGVDLSLAAFKATQHFKNNPFMHFAQASIFSLPYRDSTFSIIYSRGVLHHTYSTQLAFEKVHGLAAPDSLVYIWVYGLKSIADNLLRRTLYLSERTLRPFLSRHAESSVASAALYPLALAYMLFNALRRVQNASIQPLSFRRAVHAARDRYTPKFAHRHPVSEVEAWFEHAGFSRIEVVDWRAMPSADHDDYRRNVGLRGYSPKIESPSADV